VPARIVIVHDDEGLVTGVVAALRTAGHDVAAFKDPLLAHDAIEAAQRVEVLVTRVEFPPGRLRSPPPQGGTGRRFFPREAAAFLPRHALVGRPAISASRKMPAVCSPTVIREQRQRKDAKPSG
jgi:hypothetical protein